MEIKRASGDYNRRHLNQARATVNVKHINHYKVTVDPLSYDDSGMLMISLLSIYLPLPAASLLPRQQEVAEGHNSTAACFHIHRNPSH